MVLSYFWTSWEICFSLDVEKMSMKAKIDVEGPIILQGDYKVTGKVLVLPIQGSGRCNITISECQVFRTDASF